MMEPTSRSETNWTFLTNHAHVLICLADGRFETLREVSLRVGITERAVQRIVSDLEAGGVISRTRDGRRNRYEVNPSIALRHDLEAHKTVGDLMKMVANHSEAPSANSGEGRPSQVTSG